MSHGLSKSKYGSPFTPKLWVCLKEKYTPKIFWGDLLGGITAGVIALPVTMAFAIASGLDPQRGIYTSIVAGFLISLLGGSRVQISGTAGAFVAVIYDVVQRQGYDGLVFATLIAAIILIITGLSRLGNLIKYIPSPLVTGFTAGIAVIIFVSQLKDFFGFPIEKLPTGFLGQIKLYVLNTTSLDLATLAVSVGCLFLIWFFRRFLPMVPWAIGAIGSVTLVVWYFNLPVATIASKFGQLPRTLPHPTLPHFIVSWDMLRRLFPDALTIAFLAGSKALLSAIVADGMIGGRHKANCELVAVGIGNIGSVLFGGIPATAVIARTAANIKTGGRTPISGMIHSAVIFLIIFFGAPLASKIPIAALSATLVVIAYQMCEKERFLHLLRAPVGDIVVLLTSFLITVLIDVTVAVEVGIVLAAFLFVKRMSDLSGAVSVAEMFDEKDEEAEVLERKDPQAIDKKIIPKGVEVYEINGPFFFGITTRLKDILDSMEKPPKVFILRMRNVPVIDASGMYALKEFYLKCKKDKTELFLSGVRHETYKTLKKFHMVEQIGRENFYRTINSALEASQRFLETI